MASSSQPYFSLLKNRLIYLQCRVTERVRGSKKEGDIFHPLIHSPSHYNSQGWARPKPGARNSVLVSHMTGRASSAWAITWCFPRCTNRKTDRKQSSQDANRHFSVGCQHHKGWLNSLSHNASPAVMFVNVSWVRKAHFIIISHEIDHWQLSLSKEIKAYDIDCLTNSPRHLPFRWTFHMNAFCLQYT